MEWYVVAGLCVAILCLLIFLMVVVRRGIHAGRQGELFQRVEELSRRQTEESQRLHMEIAASSKELTALAGENQRILMQLLAGQQKELQQMLTEGQQKSDLLLREIYQANLKQNEKLYATLAGQSRQLNETLTEVVGKLQESNEKKLDQMRATVDEKLTSTLSQRLDSSFKTVGDQLKEVYRSMGEMKELASGVSDLQRVLTNVKARGTWAEVQLGNILEQTLTSDQFEQNVSIKNNGEKVEYAIKIPARDDPSQFVWLPIDSKFPQEDYVRLCDAAERADKQAAEDAAKALERTLRSEAATIARLYIDVPRTTDFAILFLATEGLYAEVLRRPGLAEELQNKYRIMVCGPTTITAFLNTLRMGFRTIALDKRAADVWKVLGAAKTQYENFESILLKARRKIEEAGNTLDEAQHRNRIIQKNLRKVQELDAAEAESVLGFGLTQGESPEEEDAFPEN